MGILIIFKVPPTLFPNQSPLGRREKLDRSESSQHGGPAGKQLLHQYTQGQGAACSRHRQFRSHKLIFVYHLLLVYRAEKKGKEWLKQNKLYFISPTLRPLYYLGFIIQLNKQVSVIESKGKC